jgi:hypothetical protein
MNDVIRGPCEALRYKRSCLHTRTEGLYRRSSLRQEVTTFMSSTPRGASHQKGSGSDASTAWSRQGRPVAMRLAFAIR